MKKGYITIFRRVIIVLILLLPAAAFPDDLLVRPPQLEPDIAFWRSIFSEVSTQQALVHDDRYLNVVYGRIEVPSSASPAERRRISEREINYYRTILKTLANGKRSGLTAEEQRVLNLWPANVTNAELRNAMGRLRTQMGLSDRFLAGLKRSGAWRPHIEKQLAARGVPPGLAALPHVESSYNPDSNSHVGAAGLWQFMRSTGQQFMEIDNVVDERRDPFRSSEAAAQLLAYNYSVLKSWPLAITAYNHGLGGMRRAVKQMGTEDIAVINRKYSAPSFGFASRNFYVSFLAALEVQENAEKYFGPVDFDPPRNDVVIESPGFIPAAAFAQALGVSQETLRSHNPALLQPVWDGSKHIPQGFTVRVPAALVGKTESQVMAALPSGQRYARQTPDAYHKVGRGESLSVIAARYDTTVSELVALNGLKSQHRIRAGQNIRLPSRGGAPAAVAAALASNSETYTVRKGDSLSVIAARTGISESVLMSRNGLRNRNNISAGQVLYLQPSEAKQSPTVVAVAAAAEPVPAPAEVSARADTAELPVAETAAAVPASTQLAAQKEPAVEKEPLEVSVAATAAPSVSGKQDADATIAAALADMPVAQAPVPAVAAVQPGSQQTDALIAGVSSGDQSEAPAEDEDATEGVSRNEAEYAATASLADPNDYSIAADGTIEIQATETLGHYADWLGIKTQRLRDINRLSGSAQLVVGRRIKLDLSKANKASFETRRIAYHREIQDAFFVRYRVTSTTEHKLQSGESVWKIAQATYNVPVWLLRQYNPDLDFGRVKPGMSIIVPKLQPIARGADNRNSVAVTAG